MISMANSGSERMRYFFDTYALFEIINQNENYRRFAEEEIVTSILNLGELYYGLLTNQGAKTAAYWFGKLKNYTIPVSDDAIRKAMDFKFAKNKNGFSFIDCTGYAIAKEHNLIFLTGDSGFRGV